MQKGLTAFQLKLIAITAMLIDHLAWYYVDLDTGLGQLLHMVGRLTAPIMCFFIAEGYRHTGPCAAMRGWRYLPSFAASFTLQSRSRGAVSVECHSTPHRSSSHSLPGDDS